MQGFGRADRQLLSAAPSGCLVPEGNMPALLAAHRAVAFPDVEYADLFPRRGHGRPSLPTAQMMALRIGPNAVDTLAGNA